MPESWQHLYKDQMDWETTAQGDALRALTHSPATLLERRLPPGHECQLSGLLLITEGSLTHDGHTLGPRTVMWSTRDTPLKARAEGTRLFQLVPNDNATPSADLEICERDARDWQAFEDPAGRPTQPVQVLLEGAVSALRTRFEPSYIAGEHWHDFDTYYFITDGDMQFGDEGQYHTGDVRRVQGGYSYGPEKPGPNGVEFVLVSLGGGVALHWSDLEPPPHGALQT